MYRRLFDVRKSLKMTQKQMADVLGIGQNAYSMIESGKIGLTPRNRALLASSLGVSHLFLERGVPPMMISEGSGSSLAVLDSQMLGHKLGVPFFSKAIRGVIASPDTMAGEEPDYYINFEPFNDCTFYRPVFGDSMSPRYNAGDIVACRRVQNRKNILFGQSYLCLLSIEGDFIETLRVLRKPDDPLMVTLMPLNLTYDSSVVALSSIVDMFVICGKIERSI